jgi:hypothetical protein
MEGVEVPDYCRVPEEAHSFIPHRSLVIQGEGNKIERFIFHGQSLEAVEERALADLEALIQLKGLKNLNYPPYWSRDDMLRCIYGTGWKADKARKVVIAHLKWLASVPTDYRLLYDSVARVLMSGAFYIHGRDSYFRPMFFLNFPKIDLSLYSVDELVNGVLFAVEFVKANMILPGVVENWLSIADLTGQGLSSLPVSALKSMIGVLQPNYRCRLGACYVLNSPRSVSWIWGMIKPFLDKQTIKKVSFTRDGVDPNMFTHVNPGQVERKYGGTAPDIMTYWPPTMPPGPFRASR